MDLRFRHIPVLLLLGLALFSRPLPAVAWSQQVVQLPDSGQWIECPLDPHERPIAQEAGIVGPQRFLYLLELRPGADYTLGLRYAAALQVKPILTLFDRWPQLPQANAYRLAAGPVVRTDHTKIEYRWRLGVSSRSPGDLAFLAVEVPPQSFGRGHTFRHALYLTTPAISPLQQRGEGITYLRGHDDLLLAETGPSDDYRVVSPFACHRVPAGEQEPGTAGENLVTNGDFAQGLRGWQLRPAGAEGVGVFRGRLRLWSRDSARPSGVVQPLDIRTPRGAPLRLSIDMRIDAQAEPIGTSGSAPLTLAVCYRDGQGADHCGENAFRRRFTLRLGEKQRLPRDAVPVPRGEWARYAFDFSELNPRPRQLTRVELSGRGAPERDVLVRSIHISR